MRSHVQGRRPDQGEGRVPANERIWVACAASAGRFELRLSVTASRF
jgi:hypothetical protein